MSVAIISVLLLSTWLLVQHLGNVLDDKIYHITQFTSSLEYVCIAEMSLPRLWSSLWSACRVKLIWGLWSLGESVLCSFSVDGMKFSSNSSAHVEDMWCSSAASDRDVYYGHEDILIRFLSRHDELKTWALSPSSRKYHDIEFSSTAWCYCTKYGWVLGTVSLRGSCCSWNSGVKNCEVEWKWNNRFVFTISA